MNKITLLGRLTKDVELKLIGDRPLAEFSLAVNRRFKNAQGERETDFFNCKLWGKTAETLQQHTMKGQQLLVSGRVENRTFTNQEGQNVRFTEVIVEEFDFVEKSPNHNQGFNQNGFNQGGYNQGGFNQNQGGFNQNGFSTVNANGNASGYFQQNQNQNGFNQNQGFNDFNGFKTGATNTNNGFNQNQNGFNVNEDDLPF
jgi:single-strand DNA-binding protein|nr:MAG TPA: Single strand binding protein [Caudoviricetes sp.]